MLLEESGQCAECNNLFASFFSPQESAEKEDLRCPYAECRKLFRRLGSYKKHLCMHAEKVTLKTYIFFSPFVLDICYLDLFLHFTTH